ncbi:hypothetical protein WR25_03667 [Diploscapter pachys]|uniref:Uncharacterized protein n=1 Tax=Diploscapter pachys TaxID=2018661 RepID=A0A2A2JYP3_9BILA|nr:hypothetical protein WR25_03667 [Diploscapter pachys]
MGIVGAMDVDAEATLRRFDFDLVGAGIAVRVLALGGEVIALQQVEDRDPPLLLDIGRAPADAVLVQGDVDDPRVGHTVR